MNTGFDILKQAMTIKLNTTDVIANNIANSNTTGFKQSNIATHTKFSDEINNQIKTPLARKETALNSSIPQISGTYLDQNSGMMQITNNQYDFAIKNPNMMFSIQLANGDIAYTKDGSFKVMDGVLTTSDGNIVLGASGSAAEIEDGKIPTPLVSQCNFKNLKPQGNNLYRLIDNNQLPTEVENPENYVLQGTLESSNVNMVESMTNLIVAHREFEQMSKLMQGIDEINKQAATEIGKA
jgi:flagellar basal-body rod protein FlgG